MSQNICNICGANYEYHNGRWKCPACGAYKAEELSNEEVTLLYHAAQKLRLSDFDEAEKAYTDIIEKFPRNPNGYWGRLLSKYGIKYEEDFDGRKIPTCYATSIESVISDKDYKKAIELADKETKEYYILQAQYIERVRKEWVEKARKEKPYDVFLCYKDSDMANGIDRTKDSIAVQDLYIHLTSQGYRVFFSRESLRDKVGEKYEPYIFNALSTAKVMLVYGSNPDYITSTWLKNEWTRYEKRIQAGEKKENSLLVACDGFSPNELPKVLAARQCFDATKRSFYGDLDVVIKNLIKGEEKPKPVVEKIEKKKQTKKLPIVLSLVVAVVAIFFGVLISNLNKDKPQGDVVTSVTNAQFGAAIVLTDDEISKSTIFEIEEINAGVAERYVINQLNIDKENYHLFDLTLKYNNEIVTIDGNAIVTMPIPNDIDVSRAVVYYIGASTSEKMSSTVSDGKISFTTNHFSYYLIAEETIQMSESVEINFQYSERSDGAISIDKYIGNNTEIEIPQKINEKNVVEISSMAFDSRDKITTILLPNTIHTIGAKAFSGCTSISSLEIPSTVVTMGTSVFYGWTNEQEIILEGVADIPNGWNAQWNGFCNAKIIYGYVTIVYNSNGGQGVMNSQQVESRTAAILMENKFILDGYTFSGWSLQPNGEMIAFDKGSFSVGKEMVTNLYAVWTANENEIIYSSNGGTGIMPEQKIPTDANEKLNKCLFTKAGYTFIGWAETASGEVVYTDGAVYTMGTAFEYHLYAVWQANTNTIIFNPNGGTGLMSNVQAKTDEMLVLPSNTFIRAGYTFEGWGLNGNDSVRYDECAQLIMGTQDVILYAVWSANTNVLMLHANNKTNTENTINIKTDESIALPANSFNYKGYTFIGWAETASGEVVYTDAELYTMGTASEYHLYAVWQANANTIIFNPNGGTGTMSNQTLKTDASANLYVCDYMYYGYVFSGWSTSPNGVVEYTDKALYTMGANSTYVLYALWEPEDVSGFTYTVSNDAATITGYQGEEENVTVPLTINGYTVKNIGTGAFCNNTKLKEITIPEYIENIGAKAFYGCLSLEKININAINLISSDSTAFLYAGNDSSGITLTFGRKLTKIPKSMFSVGSIGTPSIKKVLFEEGSVCTEIGDYAFSWLRIEEVILADSIETIGKQAFDAVKCLTISKNLRNVSADSFAGSYIEIYNKSSLTLGIKSSQYLNLYTTTSGSSRIHVDDNGYIFYEDASKTYLVGYIGAQRELILPKTYKNNSYDIYQWSFCDSLNIKNITISSGVKNIGEYAFLRCENMRVLQLEEGIESIGYWAFGECEGLLELVIPNSVKQIGSGAFRTCMRLAKVTIGSGVTNIPNDAFSNCEQLIEVLNLSTVSFFEGKTNSFLNEEYNVYTQSNGTSKIYYQDDFMYYKNGSTCILLGYVGKSSIIVLPNKLGGVDYKFYNAFRQCKDIKSITLSNITQIPKYAFYNCYNLETIIIPNSVVEIGNGAFMCCYSIKELTIPYSIQSMGADILFDCGSLQKVLYDGKMVEWTSLIGTKRIYVQFQIGYGSTVITVVCNDGTIS